MKKSRRWVYRDIISIEVPRDGIFFFSHSLSFAELGCCGMEAIKFHLICWPNRLIHERKVWCNILKRFRRVLDTCAAVVAQKLIDPDTLLLLTTIVRDWDK